MSKSFETFPKIARLSRECVITEKIDGTNAQIYITETLSLDDEGCPLHRVGADGPWIAAGSRNRWITPEDDNYGFARWVRDNAEELILLGPGRHFGEWWGRGIQRGYGLSEKRFSLFNVGRWWHWGQGTFDDTVGKPGPQCCNTVPILYQDEFTTGNIDDTLRTLGLVGSQASPGFMDPEGIVIWHTAAKTLFKKTLVNDAKGKTE